MSPQPLSRPAAFATAVALGAASAIATSGGAGASLPGGNAGLTASNNSTQIKWTSSTLTTTDTIKHASWSPDGSRAVYVDADNFVKTVRSTDGTNVESVTPEDDAAQPERDSPTWLGVGSGVVYAEKPSAADPWQLVISSTSWSSGQVISPTDPASGFHYLNPDGGPGWSWVFQKQEDDGSGTPTGTPEIWIHRDGTDTSITTDAANPALSPDGTKVAFVRDGEIWQCVVSGCTGLTQVTSDGTAKDDPTWSPDGATIAFRSGTAVATALADGSQAASPASTSLVGVPAYQTTKKNKVARLSGSNRFATAIATSQSYWATAGASDTRKPAKSVVLSRSDLFADALGGSALAAAKEGPLLMTPPTSLNAATKAEILRVLGNDTTATVYLLGGLGALSQAVENEIVAMGYVVKRLADADRYTTAIKIANEIDPTPDLVLVATGKNFPDALAAGAAAGSYNVPGTGNTATAVVILSADSAVTTAVKNYLTSKDPATTAFLGIGGQGYNAAAGAVGPENVWPVVGSNRYETALYTAWTFFGTENHVGLATGVNWPDALAGGALMAGLNGPLLLTPSSALYGGDVFHLDTMSGTIDNVLIFGGTGAVAAGVEDAAGVTMSGPAGYDKVYNPVSGVTAVAGFSATSFSFGAANPTHKSVEEIKATVEQLSQR